MSDCLQPPAGVLIKIGSALIHAQEFLEPGGHPFDKQTFDTLMADVEVVAWVEEMNALALLPKKRSDSERRKP